MRKHYSIVFVPREGRPPTSVGRRVLQPQVQMSSHQAALSHDVQHSRALPHPTTNTQRSLLGRSCAGQWGQHLERPGWQRPTCPQSRERPCSQSQRLRCGAHCRARWQSRPSPSQAAASVHLYRPQLLRIDNSPLGLHWQGPLAASAAHKKEIHAVMSYDHLQQCFPDLSIYRAAGDSCTVSGVHQELSLLYHSRLAGGSLASCTACLDCSIYSLMLCHGLYLVVLSCT